MITVFIETVSSKATISMDFVNNTEALGPSHLSVTVLVKVIFALTVLKDQELGQYVLLGKS